MSSGYSYLTLNEKTYTSLIYTLFSLLVLIFFLSAGLFMPIGEDIAFQYGQSNKENWISTQIQNGAYVEALTENLMNAYGYDYFYAIGFWILGFAVALWFCTFQFIQYVRLPTILTPLLTLAIGLHGFWAELMTLVIPYLSYATGLVASGAALLCARWYKRSPWLISSFTALCTGIALASFPPMALIPLFAVSLALIRDAFLKTDEEVRRDISAIKPLCIGFIGGWALCFIIFYLFSSSLHYTAATENSRALSITQYGLALFNPFLPLTYIPHYSLIFPLHERMLYGLAQMSAVVLALRIPSPHSRYIALGALSVGFLMSGGPLGSWAQPFYTPTLKNVAPTAFFHVSLVVILGFILQPIIEKKFPKWPLPQLGIGILCVLVFLSMGNQISLLMERWWHYEYDYAIASDIVADLRNAGYLKDGGKIAVLDKNQDILSPEKSSFSPHVMFFPDRVSAVPLLNRVSGFNLREVPYRELARLAQIPDDDYDRIYELFCHNVPKAFCRDDGSTERPTECDIPANGGLSFRMNDNGIRSNPWKIHQKDNVTFVCFSSLERKLNAQ